MVLPRDISRKSCSNQYRLSRPYCGHHRWEVHRSGTDGHTRGISFHRQYIFPVPQSSLRPWPVPFCHGLRVHMHGHLPSYNCSLSISILQHREGHHHSFVCALCLGHRLDNCHISLDYHGAVHDMHWAGAGTDQQRACRASQDSENGYDF